MWDSKKGIDMEIKNKFFKLLGYESLYMLIVTLVASGAALFQTILKKFDGTYSSFIFSGDIYKYNIFMYLLGIAIFLATVFSLYKLWKKNFDVFAELSILLKIVVCIVLIIWGFIMFIGMFALLFFTVLGLSNDLRPDYLFIFTVVGWPIVTVLFLGVQLFRNCVNNSSRS